MSYLLICHTCILLNILSALLLLNYIGIYINRYKHKFVYIYKVYTHTYIHIHTYIHTTYTHIHTHTHIQFIKQYIAA